MLLQLNINNFALIENLTMSFHKGFNVLSGETGAGKSILIDAINYVLGGKFNRDLIRTGENRTYVEAIFTIESSKTIDVLQQLSIEYDDMIIISRETFQNGKSIVKVNGKSIILSNLKFISNTLIDIHGQHENQNLLDSINHIAYLDGYGIDTLESYLKDYENSYKEFIDINNKIEEIKGSKDREKFIDYLKFQIEDIESANLNTTEEKELQERFNILTHAEKISYAINSSYGLLYSSGNDGFTSVYDALGITLKELRAIEKHTQKIKDIADNIENIYFSIDEIIRDVRGIKDTIVYDELELEKINNRIYQIGDYKKKYGNTIEDILSYKNRIKKQYEDIINSETILQDLEDKLDKVKILLEEKSKKIHEERINIGKILEKKIKDELNYIGLEKSIFSVHIEYAEDFNSKGKDKVSFLISTNPGEPLKPLEKVVSGGELSRIMLALKTVFVDKDEIPTVIFDEIDTGISGRIAQCVAEKMYVISNKHQVFCVTHLSQIASMSDHHFLVYKNVENNKTYTKVKSLSLEEKQTEIARMIGGVEVTKVTLQNSKELINMAKEKKKSLKIN